MNPYAGVQFAWPKHFHDGPTNCPKCLNGYNGIPVCTDPPCENWHDLEMENRASPRGSPEKQDTPPGPAIPLPDHYDESISDLLPRGDEDRVPLAPPEPEISPAKVAGKLTEKDLESLWSWFAEAERIPFAREADLGSRCSWIQVSGSSAEKQNVEAVATVERGRKKKATRGTPAHRYNLRSTTPRKYNTRTRGGSGWLARRSVATEFESRF